MRSFNNEIGLPLTVLRADESTRFLVLEMGASGPGHLDYLTQIAPPDVAVVLVVGQAHLGGFGGIDAVARAKSEIVQGLVSDGVAVLNADDPRVSAMAALAPGDVVTFGAAPEADGRRARRDARPRRARPVHAGVRGPTTASDRGRRAAPRRRAPRAQRARPRPPPRWPSGSTSTRSPPA